MNTLETKKCEQEENHILKKYKVDSERKTDLINHLPKELISLFFLQLIPSHDSIRSAFSVCKNWHDVKKSIHFEENWPYVRRDQIISCLFQTRFPFSISENEIIKKYLFNSNLTMHSTLEFMNQWLEQKNDPLSEIHALLIMEKNSLITFEDLLLQEQFEAAFAYSNFKEKKHLHTLDIYNLLKDEEIFYSKLIQKHLIKKFGYLGAMKLTIKFNTRKSKTLAYNAFLEIGSKDFIEKENDNSLKNEFLESLKLLGNSCFPRLHSFLQHLIIPYLNKVITNKLLKMKGMERNSILEDNNYYENTGKILEDPYILQLFHFIPDDFDDYQLFKLIRILNNSKNLKNSPYPYTLFSFEPDIQFSIIKKIRIQTDKRAKRK